MASEKKNPANKPDKENVSPAVSQNMVAAMNRINENRRAFCSRLDNVIEQCDRYERYLQQRIDEQASNSPNRPTN